MPQETHSLWLDQLQGTLEDTQVIPLWGTPPAFPWEKFSKQIADLFELSPCSLSHHQSQWLNDPLDGLGEDPALQHIALTPLPGQMVWAMQKSSQKELTEVLLTTEQKSKGFSDESFFEGFYQFTMLKILDTFNRNNLYGNLKAALSEHDKIPSEGAFCIDVNIELGTKKLIGRLICPKEFQAAFRTHFHMEKAPLLTDPNFKSLPISLPIEIGSTKLKAKDWKKVKQGDLVILDRCTYDPNTKRGTAMLTCGTVPLFDLRIKEGELKVLEYAFFKEETPMETPHDDDEFSPEELSPEDFSDDLDLDNDNEEELSLSEESLEMEEEEKPLWSAENGEKDTEKLLTSEEIPLTLTVEVARLQVPLEKLTQLKPGNVLDLAVSPQLGVHLTVGGKRIAKGELVKFGDVLAVKILKVGD